MGRIAVGGEKIALRRARSCDDGKICGARSDASPTFVRAAAQGSVWRDLTTQSRTCGRFHQRTVVAKWLGARSKVLIFDEPTRGIDINGKREIYRIMQELLEQGVGILMLTLDYTEALEMSHRIIVLHRGRMCKEFQRGEPTEADILREAIGETEHVDHGDMQSAVSE
jgi:ABC-type cobalamin/Fe3+-siderophores transport system ATPase subunit